MVIQKTLLLRPRALKKKVFSKKVAANNILTTRGQVVNENTLLLRQMTAIE